MSLLLILFLSPLLCAWLLGVHYFLPGSSGFLFFTPAVLYITVVSWLGHEAIPDNWIKQRAKLERIWRLSTFESRKVERCFRAVHFAAGLFIGLLSFSLASCFGLVWFFVTIGLGSFAVFIFLHVLVLVFIHNEMKTERPASRFDN